MAVPKSVYPRGTIRTRSIAVLSICWTRAACRLSTASRSTVALPAASSRGSVRRRWYSGETHVHRPVEQIELLMRAADLHVAEVITWWNNTNLWQSRPLPESTIVRFDGNRFYDLLAGEDERGGGALLFFQLRQPLSIARCRTASIRPRSISFNKPGNSRTPGSISKSRFGGTFPSGWRPEQIDSVGLVHNHLQRDGMLENEAWGRARDRCAIPGCALEMVGGPSRSIFTCSIAVFEFRRRPAVRLVCCGTRSVTTALTSKLMAN